jgi:DNA-binding NarL/FixJ family response regulator
VTESAQGSALDPVASLTSREKQVLELFAQGLANKLVASELSITEDTVKTHAKSIYRKLHVTSRVQAVLVLRDFRLKGDGGSDS